MPLSLQEFKDCVGWIRNTSSTAVSVTLDGIQRTREDIKDEHDKELRKLKRMFRRMSENYNTSSKEQNNLQMMISQKYANTLRNQQQNGLMSNVKEENIQRINQSQGRIRFHDKEKKRMFLSLKEQSKRAAAMKAKLEEYDRMNEFFLHVSSIFTFLEHKNINILEFPSDTLDSLYNEYKTWKVRQ